MSARKHAALADSHHEGLTEGSARSICARVLDSKLVECFILLLIFVDIGLLSIEAGIDHHLLCIEGQVVPRPAGLPPPHHALLQRTQGPLGWPIAQINNAGDDAGLEAISKSSSGIAKVDQKLQTTDVDSPHLEFKTLSRRVKGTVLHVKRKHSLADGPVTDDPKGLDTVDSIHSPSGLDHKDPERLHKKEKKHQDDQHKEVVHHKHPGHDKDKTLGDHLEKDGAHGHSLSKVLMCETRHGHHAHHITHTCHTASIIILCVFLVEISLKFWIDPSGFCHNWFLVLDATVIIVSLFTDTFVMWWVQTFAPNEKEEVAVIAGALIFIRCWRVIRIAHGLGEHLHHAHEESVKSESATQRSIQLEDELRRTKEELHQARGY